MAVAHQHHNTLDFTWFLDYTSNYYPIANAITMKTFKSLVSKNAQIGISIAIILGFLIVGLYWQSSRSDQLRSDLTNVIHQATYKASNTSSAVTFTYSIDGQDVKLVVDNDNYALVFTQQKNTDDDIADFNVGTCRKLTNDFLDTKNIDHKKVAFTSNLSTLEYDYTLAVAKSLKPSSTTSTFFANDSDNESEASQMRRHVISSICKSMKYVGDEPATLTFHFTYDKTSKG